MFVAQFVICVSHKDIDSIKMVESGTVWFVTHFLFTNILQIVRLRFMNIFKSLALITFSFTSIAANAQIMGGHGHGVNPASVLCAQKDGKEIVAATNGDANITFCKFGNAIIGKATFYYELTGTKTQAVKAFLMGKVPTPKMLPGHGRMLPLNIYACRMRGGEYVMLQKSETERSTIALSACKFKDGSIIESYTLLGSTEVKANEKLMNALGKKF